jgi:hypothetical protein
MQWPIREKTNQVVGLLISFLKAERPMRESTHARDCKETMPKGLLI